LSFRDLNIKSTYSTDTDNVVVDFYNPVLRKSFGYDRAVGYFSSKALIKNIEGINGLLENDGKMRLVIGETLTNEEYQAIVSGQDQSIQDRMGKAWSEIFNEAENIPENKLKLEVLSWLINNNKLEIKYAFRRKGLFHKKIGIVRDSLNNIIVFSGSMNETEMAISANIENPDGNSEEIDVYMSWKEESFADHAISKINSFESLWNGNEANTITMNIDSAHYLIIKNFYSKNYPPQTFHQANFFDSLNHRKELWKHQENAIEIFLEKERGILEMATGTGKTTTSLEIAYQLIKQNKVKTIIIETYGNALLHQWSKEVEKWIYESYPEELSHLSIFKEFENYSSMINFLNNIDDSILIIGKDAKKLKNLFSSNALLNSKDKVLIIHDEVHKFGSPSMIANLDGTLSQYKYSLGLSATPEREYDEGNDFIEKEVGEVIFEFGLEKAINAGILCEFNYIPISLSYSERDLEEKHRWIKTYQAKKNSKNPMPLEFLYTQLGKVRKKAEYKPNKLDKFLEENASLLENSVFFVEDMDQGNEIIEIIKKYTPYFAKFYSENDMSTIDNFANGSIKTIISCTRLDEGIDIPSLTNIFLVSATRAKLSNIQRLGRCLRKDMNNPNKKASVVDFIVIDHDTINNKDINADESRRNWLKNLSKIKKHG